MSIINVTAITIGIEIHDDGTFTIGLAIGPFAIGRRRILTFIGSALMAGLDHFAWRTDTLRKVAQAAASRAEKPGVN